jgi:hypothetical protein
MAGGDRTGPSGMGPMTGRGLGYCTGNSIPGYNHPGCRRNTGRGRGLNNGVGWQHRHWCYNTGMRGWQQFGMGLPMDQSLTPGYFRHFITKEQELEVLKHQAKYFTTVLDDLKQRINKIDPPVESPKTE